MFCQNCGTQLSDNVKFCHSCGAAMEADVQPFGGYAPAQPPCDQQLIGFSQHIRNFTAKNRSLGVFGKVILCLLGVFAVFLFVQNILLSAFGVNTSAVVYRAEQQQFRDTDDRYDPTRFELSYRYTVDGATYEGKDTMYFEYGYVTEMGVDGKEIPKTAVVRYLPSVPSWSKIVSVPGGKHSPQLMENPLSWLGFGLLVLLIVVMVNRGRRLRKQMESEGTL